MSVRLLTGDCRDVLATLPAESVHCVVTSPPYWSLRDYGVAGQIGLEASPEIYVAELVAVFREVRRILRADGTLWLNLGDCYSDGGRGGDTGASGLQGSTASQDASKHHKVRHPTASALPAKNLVGIPWRVAFALQADGWWLRQDIIWSKPNPMPESVTDRCTKAHEYLFLLSESERYYYDAEAIREDRTSDEDAKTFRGGSYIDGLIDNATLGKRSVVGNRRIKMPDGWDTGAGGHGSFHRNGREKGRTRGLPPRHAQYLESSDQSGLDDIGREEGRNRRSVWTIATAPFKEAHFATFPPALVEPCILAGCPEGGTVLDPFGGSGTVGLVADRLQRNAILIELNPEYARMARRRLDRDQGSLFKSVIEGGSHAGGADSGAVGTARGSAEPS